MKKPKTSFSLLKNKFSKFMNKTVILNYRCAWKLWKK